MRRRDFLAMVGAGTSLAVLRRSFAQPGATRGAIVIGVDKAGNLPVLNAAASGARQVAVWLRAEGFEVKEFVDDAAGRPVTVADLFEAVDGFTHLDTLEQLVVYFSGHGFLLGYSEHWLLSKAPANPNESVSTVESVALARFTGIRNVVFISDACRSTTDSLGVQGMRGGLIFPSRGSGGGSHIDVDQFFAASPGEAALELPVDQTVGKFEGIYTAAFLNAYRQPDQTMVKTVGGVTVVPNRLMRDYLTREVQKRAETAAITLTQQPDARVESDDTTYIGRVAGTPVALAVRPPPATIADVAVHSLERAGVATGTSRARPATGVDELANDSGFSDVQRSILSNVTSDIRIETRTGFVVFGAPVLSVVASRPEMEARLEQNGEGERPAIVRLAPTPGSVALRFADGSGTVVASLPFHVGTITVREGGVANLSYLTQDVDRGTLARLNEMRASVAAAAQYGVFRLEGDRATRNQSAGQLADRIRVMKGIDPSLGIYAAYAYFDADLLEKVQSVRNIMRGDLGFDIFDVAMLAGALAEGGDHGRVEPLFPMFTQGWSLLRVRGVKLPDRLLELGGRLRSSLWTTFDEEGMKIVERFVRG